MLKNNRRFMLGLTYRRTSWRLQLPEEGRQMTFSVWEHLRIRLRALTASLKNLPDEDH